ncbi:uncharacterized protein LOC128205143 [Mya arenaria]|uniref:uncharacterized protein LOC128205143 n=1 Tax=Mya arenaria TaxID=6604 RepID=UPI0022E4C350|nr:uncharacterized protein LOC128205143 [Mya arenaria]
MRGNVIKVFEKDDDDKKLFQFPDYLAVSPDLSTIYISDFNNDTLTLLTQEGRVLDVVKDNYNIYDPRNVTVDSAGRVYVCGQSFNAVSRLSPETGTVTALLGGQDVSWPRCVATSDRTGCLYVGMGDSKLIEIFENPK